MSVVHTIYQIILDALFPLSPAEKELFAYSPEQALVTLPPTPPGPTDTMSVFAYKDERVRKLIWNIKYKKSAKAVSIAAHALYRTILTRYPLVNRPAILIPIPITSRRRRERGFNQCELLVDEIARLDTDRKYVIEKNILIRTQHTSRHTLKGRQERLSDAKGIFTVNEMVKEKIPTDALIIVIDDVITTGSTLKEAMDTLRNSGFRDVKGVSVAH